MSSAGDDKHGEDAGDRQQDGDQRQGQTCGFLFGMIMCLSSPRRRSPPGTGC
ncbi:hypothetical protein [Rhizobium leguminosarum]|uniref:hypothetical protein n=1 Tax=Rhizobium leguminosarum TaxID=384 RepID=UPI001AE583EB|nr:hypothetical protein [Rhizobium leguminosarum]MBP2446229.1 hypothetical protein [Rhizobium leguminosarum]